MDNKHNNITTEASSEGILNSCTKPNISHITMNIDFNEKVFDAIINNIKVENDSLFHDKLSDSEDFDIKAYKFIDNKNKKQQDEMCKLASTSYEKDVNVSESNLQELTDTELVDSKIVSMHTSSPSTTLPIMKILSPKSEPHICAKCNKDFRVLDSPLHICRTRSIDKQNEFLKNVKKRRLDEKYSSYENNSTDDNIAKSYSNISNITPPKFKRTLKKIPYFGNKEKSFKKRCVKNVLLDNDISDSDSLSDSIILSDSGSLSDLEIIAGDSISLDDETFSESNSEEILPHCEETDYLVVASEDDLRLDSDCDFVNSKLEIKPNHKTEMGCTFVFDSEKSVDSKIILNGENNTNNYTTLLGSAKGSNCDKVLDAETESDSDVLSNINISVTKEEFNNKIISDVPKGSDYKILLNDDKIIETTSWSEKGTIKYKIITDDEIKPSGNKVSTCIIISDNDDEFKNQVFSTYKINVPKGSETKILLDGDKVVIISESENRNTKYEIIPSGINKSKCIIIFDNDKEFNNKELHTLKIVSNVIKGSDCDMLLNREKVYDIVSCSDNGEIRYMIVSKDVIKSSTNSGSQYTETSDNDYKFINKKSIFKIFVKNVQKGSHSVSSDDGKSLKMLSDSENEVFYEILNYKKVSDIVEIVDTHGLKTLDDNETINDSQLQIKFDTNRHSFPCLELSVYKDGDVRQETNQEYFEKMYSTIRYYFENTENRSLKQLYSRIGNDADMLLYLMENLRMLYNEELVISETADEFSKDYLKKQKTTLYNFFGDPKGSINASKPFINPSSHLHQYSKRLSSITDALIIKDITSTTSTSIRSNSTVGSKLNNIRTSKLLPSNNSAPKSFIPYLPDDNQTFTNSHIQHQTNCNIQLPTAIKKKSQQ